MQAVIVAMIVAGCGAHAAWKLMPAQLRRSLALRLLRLNPPRHLAAVLQRATRTGGRCGGCDSCGSAPKPITFHRR